MTNNELLCLLPERISLWDKLKTATKPIYLYGMGDGALKIMEVLSQKDIPLCGIFASDEFVRGHSFCGYTVQKLCEVKARHGSEFIALLAFASFRDEVISLIQKTAEECELYAPDVPVIKTDDTVFDLEYIKAHPFGEVYDMLADDLSRQVFLDTLSFKISGKIDYLFNSESDISEVYKNIIKPSAAEAYVDLGAYTGDTVSEYLGYSGGASYILAVEPDAKNYKKLLKRVQQEQISRIECMNVGAWDSEQVLSFATLGGRNSTLQSGGKTTVLTNSVDNLLCGRRADIIKLDVEGAEEKALMGAVVTIKKYQPRLMVSAYHKNEDLFALPMLIRTLDWGYKIYLRHHRYIPAWETNYYCVKAKV